MATIDLDGNTYQVYITDVQADAYLAADAARAESWAALGDDAKARNIITATRRLDRLRWKGEKSDPDQPNAWPRDGVGVEFLDDGETPQQVLDACALLAGDLALDASAADKADAGSNIKRVGAGSASVEFFRPVIGPKLSPPLTELLRDFFEAGISAGTGNYASDTSGASCFESSNPYGKTAGYP